MLTTFIIIPLETANCRFVSQYEYKLKVLAHCAIYQLGHQILRRPTFLVGIHIFFFYKNFVERLADLVLVEQLFLH